jgi:hypothetical protein
MPLVEVKNSLILGHNSKKSFKFLVKCSNTNVGSWPQKLILWIFNGSTSNFFITFLIFYK